VLLFALIVAAGCTTAASVQLGKPTAVRHPLTDPSRIAVYRNAEQVPGKYDEVALLTSTQQWGWTFSENRTYDALKKEASKVGANAIILDSITEPSTGAKVAAMLLGAGAERKGKALAVYVYSADETK
jgi:hypothetical protein